MLLNEQLQNEDGTLIYKLRYTPYAGKPIGTVEYLQKGLTAVDKLGPYDQELLFFKGKEFKDWASELGLNIFEGHIPARSDRRDSIISSSSIRLPSQLLPGAVPEAAGEEDRTLSNLLLGSRKPIDEAEVFTLDIFHEVSPHRGSLEGAHEKQQALKLKPKVNNAFKDKILGELEEVQKPRTEQEEEEEDLLDMLDNATK